MAELKTEQWQAIEAQLLGGNKIEAIKLYREDTGASLANAKQAVEKFEVDLRQRSPEKFTAPARKIGCLGLLAAITLLMAVGTAISFYILRS